MRNPECGIRGFGMNSDNDNPNLVGHVPADVRI
jgi:hypothetical protein